MRRRGRLRKSTLARERNGFSKRKPVFTMHRPIRERSFARYPLNADVKNILCSNDISVILKGSRIGLFHGEYIAKEIT